MRLAALLLGALLALVPAHAAAAAPSSPCRTVDDTLSIGSAPTVDAPGPDAIAVLLGTAMRVTWRAGDLSCDRPNRGFLVQAAEVHTVGEPDDTRLVEVLVRFRALRGVTRINRSDFVMLGEDGVRYDVVDAPPEAPKTSLPDAYLLPQAGVIEGAIYFEVPTRSAGLLLGFDPSPADELAGRWTLSAP